MENPSEGPRLLDVNKLTIDDLLRFMVEQGASDLHLKPMRPPLLRIAGRLLPLQCERLELESIPRMLDPIMKPKQRAQLEEQQSVDFGHSVPGLSRFRCSLFQQRGSLSGVFRRVPFKFNSLEEWGLPDVLQEFANLPQGLVLITGPTGSGKSSTMAAMMRRVTQTRMGHVVTIEDPIEFLLSDSLASVSQREVGSDTPSFQAALRNVLRQDPDVIMVGEMRDAETVQTVLTAAETGHLVFSTMHTNSAAQTVDRIVDSFPDGNHRQILLQLSSVLEAVVSMKLVERKDGHGLIAAVEILRKTPQVSKLIQEGKLDDLHEEIEKSVSYHRMQSLNQALAALVLNGAITPERAIATSTHPGDLDLMLRKFLYKSRAACGEDQDMADSLSDFSKITELLETSRLYEEAEQRHALEIAERDTEIARLHEELRALANAADPAQVGDLQTENERLDKQAKVMRQEFESKIERLNARIRELSTTATTAKPAPELQGKGFFRR